ncbi:hypothetical protein AYO40_04845 [Planctomycetaceae bacterium SCGC AG-212-D15]|nr:hypothetical protein AYO40_04845 [Planctomycetaceae bacterium SCGC AG-212-D15]
MAEKLTKCPSCAAPLKVADTLAAGTALLCPKCATRFVWAAKPQAGAPSAGRKDEAPSAPAPPAQAPNVIPPSSTTPSSATARLSSRLVACPKCKLSLRVAVNQPPATLFKCPRCTTPFRVGAPPSPKPAAPKKTALPAAKLRPTQVAGQRPKTALAGRPRQAVRRLRCPSCAAILIPPAGIGPGKRLQCPKCKKPLVMPALPANGAAKPAARPAKAAGTRLAGRRPMTKLSPEGRRPVYRLVCPACKAVMTAVGTVPVGRKLQCLSCKHELFLRAKAKPVPGGKAPTNGPANAPAAKTPAAKVPTTKTPATKTPTTKPPATKAPFRRNPAGVRGSVVPLKKSDGPVQHSAMRPSGVAAKPIAPHAARSAHEKPTEPKTEPSTTLLRRATPFLISLLLSAGILAAAAGFYFKLGPFEPGPIPAEDWTTFTAPDGRCRLEGPGDFFEQYTALAHGPGIDRVWRFTLNRDREDATFLLTYSDRRKDTSFDAIYRAERDYVVEYMKGTLIEERDVNLDAHAGKEFSVRMGWQGRLRARIYRVEGPTVDRIYIVLVAGNHLQASDTERFLESFRLVER